LRVAWFTPLRDGAIADYSRGVLAAMIRLCEPHLFCEGPSDRVPAGIAVTDLAARPEAVSELASFDAVFYNLGDDFRQHPWIFDVARRHPGIVVLHDGSLHRFFLDYYVQQLGRPDLYITRMAEHYGIAGLTTAHRILGPWLDPESARIQDRDLLTYTFIEEALRRARGAIVHSRWHGAIARKLWSGPVCESWLPIQRPSAPFVPADTRSEGLADRPITLMMLGPVEPRAHVAEVIELLAEDLDLATRIRCVIAGPDDPADACVRELKAMIERCGLGDSVLLLPQLPPTEIDRCARAADVFINLRQPEDGAGLMSLMYELPFGKPVITYDRGPFAELPDDAVAKVAIGDGSGLRARLWELVESHTRRRAIGSAAKRFAEAHGTRDYARRLLRFAMQGAGPPRADQLAEEASRAVAERIAVDIGESLASLGAQPGSPGVDAVITEARTLLWPHPS
jgi:glycosyltransferase involved in cell wall biosynthesis